MINYFQNVTVIDDVRQEPELYPQFIGLDRSALEKLSAVQIKQMFAQSVATAQNAVPQFQTQSDHLKRIVLKYVPDVEDILKGTLVRVQQQPESQKVE